IRRRRRIWFWRGDRHRHRPAARARTCRRRAAYEFQVSRARQRTNAALTVDVQAAARAKRDRRLRVGEENFRTAMNCEFPLPRQAAPTVPFKPRTGSPVVTGTGRIVWPPHGPGMRIGLFGGTFDPVHAAHRAACLLAMKRLGLDRGWWLVTPRKPLKDTRGLAPLAERVHAAQVLAHHPRIDVTDLETQLGTRYTHQTIAYLRQGC